MPYLHYRDPGAALDFLARAFGFEVRFAHREGGVVRHAQVGVGKDTFMLGPVYPAMGSAVASELPGVNASIWCYVDDADAHCARARAAGAKVLREPMDQPYGVREYDALDCEGQEWYFCQPLDAGLIAPQTKRKPRRAKRAAKGAVASRKRSAKRRATQRRTR
jgi:uncharacterized glyoxalase superfamily protein PhnB